MRARDYSPASQAVRISEVAPYLEWQVMARKGARHSEAKVFLSYRRTDSSGHAGRLYDVLVQRFGRDGVFMDIDAIPLGAEVNDVIREAVASCDVLLAVVGRGWLGAPDGTGGRRIDRADDFVRLEIRAAFENGVAVLPVLVNGAEMPASADLPSDLLPFGSRNAVELSDRHWHSDVEQLCRALLRLKEAQSGSVPPSPKSSRRSTPANRPGRLAADSERQASSSAAVGDGVSAGGDEMSSGSSPRRRRSSARLGVAAIASALALVAVGVWSSGGDEPAGACASGVVKAAASSVPVPDGTLVTDGVRIGLVGGGALLTLSPPAAFQRATGAVRTVSPADFDRIDRRPRDGAVFEVSDTGSGSGTLYLGAGGAVFPTEPAALRRFAPKAPAPVALDARGLAGLPRSPRTGSLVRAGGPGSPVWLIRDGSREIATSLCSAPLIIELPKSPGVLDQIPRRGLTEPRSVTSTTTAVAGAVQALPDPGDGFVAKTCRREGANVLVNGSVTNTFTIPLDFTIDVRLVAADATPLTSNSTSLRVGAGATSDWSLVVDGPSEGLVDHCEYLVSNAVPKPTG